MKRKFLFILLLIVSIPVFATHNRAGEITYRQIGPLTYEITIVTYTYTLSPADRPQLEVHWGDGSYDYVDRIEKIQLPNYYQRNTYKGIHTYPGPGTYEIFMEDPNRNEGVLNIPGSVNVPFSIKTILQINPTEGQNNTPVLLNPPIDKAAVGQLFIHNPAAFDPDGDSLSYELTVCLGENGQPIPGYTYPPASHDFYVDPVSGDLVWNTPTTPGKYNVAMLVEEWRNGVKIGKIVRDMQIEVYESNNHAPTIDSIPDMCVVAGTTVELYIDAYDQDNDIITLTGNGGPFYVDSTTTLSTEIQESGHTRAKFTWHTGCEDVRKQPYEVVIKADDNNDDLALTNTITFNIKVVAPAPQNLQIVPGNNTMALSWEPCICSNAKGYYIYRRRGSYNYTHSSCETGIPESTGYHKIAQVDGWSNTTFIDDNDGQYLDQGYTYCYRVDAFFKDSAESYISDEICSELVRGIPIITNVSVEKTSADSGKIYVAWSKPTEYDTVNAPGPYKYLIYRSDGIHGLHFTLIDSTSDINDTIYIDSLLNTQDSAYSYKIEFYNDQPGNRFLIGQPDMASSIYIKTTGLDNSVKLYWDKNVPWINEKYIIYRYNNSTQTYDSIGVTYNDTYTDTGLHNGTQYCYLVKSIGHYNINNIIDPIENYSQTKCDIPQDTIPPCTPALNVASHCTEEYNELNWSVDSTCLSDIVSYNIYYSPFLNKTPEVIANVDKNHNSYNHIPQVSMAGCYQISALDSVGNESPLSDKICVDSCSYYELPNVFTPNGDGINDVLHPRPYKFVDHIDLKIFNRWGTLVFETTDPDINWDGKIENGSKKVAPGVYYYVCDVYEYRLTGIVPRTLKGFIHIFYSNKDKNE